MARSRTDYIRQRQAYVDAREARARMFGRAGAIITAIRRAADPEEVSAIMAKTAAERRGFTEAINLAIEAEHNHRKGARHG